MTKDFLSQRLEQRQQDHALRTLRTCSGLVDFFSNDYLGIVANKLIRIDAHEVHGSTGSRLLAGNYPLIEETEALIAGFHQAEAGLIFNSGYDANVGLLSSIAGKGDTIIYDQLSHASIRDGIRLSFAQGFSFRHNDMEDLEKKLHNATGNVFIVTESVFSMDGDIAPLQELVRLCQKHTHVIVDEAHATGVIGRKGEGLVQDLSLEDKCLARVHTFGKACGVHGAIILGSNTLRSYLVNFARSLIYTTALPPASISAIKESYGIFPAMEQERSVLQGLIEKFQSSGLNALRSRTPIQPVLIGGNERARTVAERLQKHQFDVRPILYPTVPKGTERLRVVLHSFNTKDEVGELIGLLKEA